MLSEILKWGSKRADAPARSSGASVPATETLPVPSKALSRFLTVLAQRPAPLVIDLGPVVGNNVSFFGERLGCKLVIEDIFASIDRNARAGTMETLPASFAARFPYGDASVDGVLCWDCFDFLDASAAKAMARQIVRLVRPGGVVMGIFCTTSVPSSGYTRFEVTEESSLRHVPHPGGGGSRNAIRNGDIIRMFEGLTVADSFLLKNNSREMLLRRS